MFQAGARHHPDLVSLVSVGGAYEICDPDAQHFNVCSRHCVVDGKRRLEDLMAFGSSLSHVALFPAYDLAVMKGLEGPHFKLSCGAEIVGDKVCKPPPTFSAACPQLFMKPTSSSTFVGLGHRLPAKR